MSREEFQKRVRAARRVMLPFMVIWLAFLFSGPFGVFAFAFSRIEPVLQRFFGASHDTALVVFTVLLGVSLVLPLVLVMWVSRRYGLVCSQCGSWTFHTFFISYVSRHGQCPKCKSQIVDAASYEGSSGKG